MSEPTTDPAQAGLAEAGFDQTLIALRQLVERLESGSLSLEASLQAFEEGIRLARRGTQILDAAEHRVEVLTTSAPANSEPGEPGEPGDIHPQIQPFTPSSP